MQQCDPLCLNTMVQEDWFGTRDPPWITAQGEERASGLVELTDSSTGTIGPWALAQISRLFPGFKKIYRFKEKMILSCIPCDLESNKSK